MTLLFDLEFIGKHEKVIFLGPPGVGVTHLAISLATKACHNDFKVNFTAMDTLKRKLKELHSRHKAYLTSSPLVVVDEVGYQPIDSRPVTPSGDHFIAKPILGNWRLFYCRVINIKGHIYRLRKHALSKRKFGSRSPSLTMASIIFHPISLSEV